MTIYTRFGDRGQTRLLDGSRVDKDAPRLEACGTIDELNAALGLVRAESLPDGFDRLLERVQNELFRVGACLSAPDPPARDAKTINSEHINNLEHDIDQIDETLWPLGEFILPGGTRQAAGLHLARTVCRRAERRLVTLANSAGQQCPPRLIAYLNRLGDFLFVLARAVNSQAGREDPVWRK